MAQKHNGRQANSEAVFEALARDMREMAASIAVESRSLRSREEAVHILAEFLTKITTLNIHYPYACLF